MFFAAVRYDLTAILLLVLARISYEQWHPKTRFDVLTILLSGGFLIAANNALLFLGQQYTTSAIAAVTHSLNPILTMLVAYAVLPDKRFSALDVLGIVIGLGGVVVIARPDPSNFIAGDDIGIILVLFAAASVAVGSVALDESIQPFPACH